LVKKGGSYSAFTNRKEKKKTFRCTREKVFRFYLSDGEGKRGPNSKKLRVLRQKKRGGGGGGPYFFKGKGGG